MGVNRAEGLTKTPQMSSNKFYISSSLHLIGKFNRKIWLLVLSHAWSYSVLETAWSLRLCNLRGIKNVSLLKSNWRLLITFFYYLRFFNYRNTQKKFRPCVHDPRQSRVQYEAKIFAWSSRNYWGKVKKVGVSDLDIMVYISRDSSRTMTFHLPQKKLNNGPKPEFNDCAMMKVWKYFGSKLKAQPQWKIIWNKPWNSSAKEHVSLWKAKNSQFVTNTAVSNLDTTVRLQ